jgi:hypothetical protein
MTIKHRFVGKKNFPEIKKFNKSTGKN